MKFPSKYKDLLKTLMDGPPVSLPVLVEFFTEIHCEIETNRYLAGVTHDFEPDGIRMDYMKAREIVSKSIIHPGFLIIDEEVHDSIDDCADLLIDLDLVKKLECIQPAEDVWWSYIFNYDLHFGDHMKNLEVQACWLNSNHRKDANK